MPRETARHDFPLDRVQRWMQAVIVHPGNVQDAIVSPGATREIPAARVDELVRPSHSLAPVERVEIYHEMYLLRMVEALESDYPAVRHYLGEDAFAELVRDYVQWYPSKSYTLNRLGDFLPTFLAADAERPENELLADLARVELAVTETFDEEQSPVLRAEAVRDLPPEAWASARLVPIKALRLLELRYAANPHLDAAKRDWPAPQPRRRRTWMAIYRRDYSVYRDELTSTEFHLLRALANGKPLGEAVAAAALELRPARREETIFRWFRAWISAGMFSRIETD